MIKKRNKVEIQQTINILVVVALIAVTASQFVLISSMNQNKIGTNQNTGTITTTDSSANLESVIPTGTPDYGYEIGVSFDTFFDEPDTQIEKMAAFDQSISFDSMTTTQQQKYIEIGTSISCEFCCGAEAIIFSNGQAACGCAHSYAMRGLTKYLLTEHPEYSNEQILGELVKWKTMYFPKQMTAKLNSGADPLANAPDMVGGC